MPRTTKKTSATRSSKGGASGSSSESRKRPRRSTVPGRDSASVEENSIPEKIRKVIQSLDWESGVDEEDAARVVRDKFQNDLRLPHVDEDTILNCEGDETSLEKLAMKLYLQTERAYKVFDMLDSAGKGVVVLEDIQQVAGDVFEVDGGIEEDEMIEMIDEFDQSGGSGLLTKDDFVRIARAIGL